MPRRLLALAPSVHFAPTLAVDDDVNLGRDLYAVAGASHAVRLAGRAVALGAAGCNRGPFGADAGLRHVDLAWDRVAVTPSLAHVHSFDNTGRPGGRFVFGLSVSR